MKHRHLAEVQSPTQAIVACAQALSIPKDLIITLRSAQVSGSGFLFRFGGGAEPSRRLAAPPEKSLPAVTRFEVRMRY